jgi:D-alanine-D-alanine ligase
MEGLQGLVCLKVDRAPGMTETLPVPVRAGVTFEELVRWMVEDALLER